MLKLPYPVKLTIVSEPILPCAQGFKVGDSWAVAEPALPDDFCLSAWDVLHPWVMAIGYGVQHKLPHMKSLTETRVSCADRRCRVVFEVKRLEGGKQ
jgi:uncharacterized repeat protein (TIGR04076 family)